MHKFDELVYTGLLFSISALNEANSRIINELQEGASTNLVQSLRMIQSQKAIIAIGMFSIFESILQQGLSCKNGFDEAKEIITKNRNTLLLENFENFYLAINVLKHGRGRSYDDLVGKAQALPFRVKLPGNGFFDEGDVSEILTLIDVDDDFLLACAQLIKDVSNEVRVTKADYFL